MKKSKNIILLLVILLTFTFNAQVNAFFASNLDGSDFSSISSDTEEPVINTNPQIDTRGNGQYAITKYDVNIVVNENNTFDIVENIQAYFNVDKHGILRKIPIKNELQRLDGTTSKNKTTMSNLNVNEQYSLSKDGNYNVIKIGSPDYTLTGEKNYLISYKYNIGKDTGDGYDELYFDMIGTEWDTTISDVTFTITMPKEFDVSKLGFSSGRKGSVGSSNITYDVKGNVITGSYNGILQSGEGITVRLELPEGYFVGAADGVDVFAVLSIIIPIIFAIICFLLWFKFGRDDRVVETVEFYPPEGLNSAELGFIYKGTAETKDVISLLLYLANKGYIKITETEHKTFLSKKKSFTITKLRDYDGDNPSEKLFFKGLFDSASTSRSVKLDLAQTFFGKTTNYNYSSMLQEVTAEDLQNNFYVTLDAIKAMLNTKQNKHQIFEKGSLNKIIPVVLMVIATFILITVKPILEHGEPALLIPALLFPGIGFSILFVMVFGKTSNTMYVNGRPTNSPVARILFGLAFGLMFGGIPWVSMVLPALLEDPMYLIVYIIGIACIAAMVIFAKIMPKRTVAGTAMLGKIRGFRNFLQTAEKPRLERLVMENPTYFYDILPFTYVLGVSDKWIKQFETIALQAPDWYESNTAFNMITFGSFMNSTMSSASSAMSSRPSESSSGGSGGGGGFSGGGFSGGGSGGGGGGSW